MTQLDFNQIINEWSYRLPKGYPTMKDGVFVNHEEIEVLREVLKEHGVNELPNFVKIQEQEVPVTEVEVEETNTFSKQDLVDLINATSIPQNKLTRIMRIVDAVSSEEGIMDLLKTQKQFDNTSAKQVFDMATDSDSYRALLEMLRDESKQISVGSLGESGNIMEVIAPTGVTREFADDMASMVPYTSVKMGRYEMFLRLFLRGGKSPTKKGDVEVNGEEMEVKSTISKGSGFRLRGSSGWGNGKQVQLNFLSELKDVYGKGEPTNEGSQSIPQEVLDAYKSQNGQMWYKGRESWAVLASKDLIETGLLDKDEVVDLWAKSLSLMYPDTTVETIKPFIAPAFSDDGSVDVSDAISRLAAYEFSVYRAKEGFAYFIALNYKDDYALISPDTQGEDLVEVFKNTFKVVSSPNTKNNSTPQDSLTAVELA